MECSDYEKKWYMTPNIAMRAKYGNRKSLILSYFKGCFIINIKIVTHRKHNTGIYKFFWYNGKWFLEQLPYQIVLHSANTHRRENKFFIFLYSIITPVIDRNNRINQITSTKCRAMQQLQSQNVLYSKVFYLYRTNLQLKILFLQNMKSMKSVAI